MTIAVVGTGYVGLVSAACFAELGHTVWGIDIDAVKISMLQEGKSPIFEPGLEELLERGLQSGRLRFTTDLASILSDVQIVFSAVATPEGENHKADLRAVFTVAETVAKSAEQDLVFVNKSTVPVGTGRLCEERINAILQDRKKDIAIPVISNPEFLREGMAVSDTLAPERIIVGVNGNDRSIQLMEDLYRPITRTGKPMVFMSRESAEIVKYAANAFLATKISFINMLTELCEKTGGNIRDIATGMGLDGRIGPRFLHAGIGYGGSCFPKDVKALLATAEEYGVAMPIVAAADLVNMHQRTRFIDLLLRTLPTNATVGIWGLSFKPKTDDMRDAPSIDILEALVDNGHTIRAYDPAATERAKTVLPAGITYCETPLEAAANADAVVLLTEWDVFRGIDLPALKKTMKGDLLFDGRNIYEPREAAEAGLQYRGVGIGPA